VKSRADGIARAVGLTGSGRQRARAGRQKARRGGRGCPRLRRAARLTAGAARGRRRCCRWPRRAGGWRRCWATRPCAWRMWRRSWRRRRTARLARARRARSRRARAAGMGQGCASCAAVSRTLGGGHRGAGSGRGGCLAGAVPCGEHAGCTAPWPPGATHAHAWICREACSAPHTRARRRRAVSRGTRAAPPGA